MQIYSNEKNRITFCSIFIVIVVFGLATYAGALENNSSYELTTSDKIVNYKDYISVFENSKVPQEEIIIPAQNYKSTDMAVELLDSVGEDSGSFTKTLDEGYIEWEFEVEQAGLYNIGIRYYPVKGKNSSIERELYIDGEVPFFEARNLIFQRVWTNEGSIKRDNRDNDLIPRQVEKPIWQETSFKDLSGYYAEPYKFYFSEGRHTLRLVSTKEPMLIEYIKVYQEDEVLTYDQYYEINKDKRISNVDFLRKIQGEDAVLKSDPTLYPVFDRSSPSTEPYHPAKIRLNTIGANSASFLRWATPGQWLTWNFEVPEDGFYKISIKFIQSFAHGLPSSRKLLIDGKVPFSEMNQIEFYYDSEWQSLLLGNGDIPYEFYLTKGMHELKLEVTLGSLTDILRTVENSIYNLNTAYRQIIMITGTIPDPYRDYQLDKSLPDVIKIFREEGDILQGLASRLLETTGQRGSEATILQTLAFQMKDFYLKPETIPKRLDAFKSNIGGLGSWILTTKRQPLQIDYIVVASPEAKLPSAKTGFLRKVWHEVSSFVSSFLEDYNLLGNIYEDMETIDVWIGSGRDQAQILKQMIDDTFTEQTGIGVNLKLVQGALLQATVAGIGPDVALDIPVGDPINYATRNAVQNLAAFPDFTDIAARFRDSALLPFTFREGVYALPEKQTFPMLFYRKDVMEELNLPIPKTWDDIAYVLPELQKHNFDFGIPFTDIGQIGQSGGVTTGGMFSFGMMLYQRGGEFYKEDGRVSALDSEIAIEAFRKWTELYSNYKIPIKYDVANRFRTGEIPLAIADYTLYNQLTVFAPELRGMWDFALVPGLCSNDGIIRRDIPGTVTGCMIMNTSQNKDSAWEFIKWWTSTDTQVRFGVEMESLMGAAARHPTANIEALEQLPWPKKDIDNLMEQWQWVRGIPEVPGGYFTGRHLENAFRNVTNTGADVRETLLDYVMVINEEIAAKRKEFGLD